MPLLEAPLKVFCSYAYEDEALCQQLHTHLSPLQRNGLLSFWYNRQIVPSTNWTKTIDTHLNNASIILLLISSHFFASDYCFGIEMQTALKRHQAHDALVIPILLRPVDWKIAPFAHLSALPTNQKSITEWRNRDAAFTDIATGIRQVIEDITLFSTSTPRMEVSSVWSVPYQSNPFFTGREELLSRLRIQLTAVKTAALTQPQAISGLGGIGKTQIALEYAYRYRNAYHFVFWASAATRETLLSDFVTIADLLQLPERNEQDQNQVIIAVKKWFVTHQEWLLILDNADDIAMVRDFVPTENSGHIVLTSRAQALGSLAQRIDVEDMGMAEGTLFLLRRTKLLNPDVSLDQISKEHLAEAEAIVIEMAFLPLALDQAGAYIDEVGCNLSVYLDLYQTHRKEILRRRSQLPTDHPEPVATTWSLSFQKVEQANRAAADLLRLCAFLEPDTIPEDLISEGSTHLGPILRRVAKDALKLNEAIEELRKFSLIQRNPETKTLRIHRLVQAVLKDAMKRKHQRQWAERAIQATSAVFPETVEQETWLHCRRYLPQAQSCAELIQDYAFAFEEAASLLYRTAFYLQDYALYEQAEPLYQQALHIREQALGPDHPDVATSLTGLANLSYRQGKYEQAEPLYQQALYVWEQTLGSDHPKVAHALTGLASVLFAQGKYAEAESLYQRALHIEEQALGPDHQDVATQLNNLAELYREQGKTKQAEPLFLRALSIWEQALGPDHPDTTYALGNLAELYHQQGKYEQAEPLLLRTLYILEQAFGPEHQDVAYALNDLANLYREQGKAKQAEPFYQQALSIREQALRPQHPDIAETLYDFAVFREVQGENHEAIFLYQRALAIRVEVLGLEHPKTKATQAAYTTLLQKMEPQDSPVHLELSTLERTDTEEESKA